MNGIPDFLVNSRHNYLHDVRLVVMYMAIGLALGFLEWTIAKAVFRDNPRRKAILSRKQFQICMLMNSVAWPGVLVWLVLLGTLKGLIIYQSKKR
jgi:hypothetical protein